MARSSSQAYDLKVSPEPLDPERTFKFAVILTHGIVDGLGGTPGGSPVQATLFDEETAEESSVSCDDLTALLSISAWMNFSGAELSDTLRAMLRLRDAVVAAADLDGSTEPVPLLPPDPMVAALNLARYLEDLFRRASKSTRVTARAVGERALELLVA